MCSGKMSLTENITLEWCVYKIWNISPMQYILKTTDNMQVMELSDYSLHQKKVSTCDKAKYSKTRVSTGKVGGASHPKWSWSKVDQASFWFLWISKWGLAQFGPTQWLVWRTPNFSSGPLSFEYLAWQKCIHSFGGDCMTSIVNKIHRLDVNCCNELFMSTIKV